MEFEFNQENNFNQSNCCYQAPSQECFKQTFCAQTPAFQTAQVNSIFQAPLAQITNNTVNYQMQQPVFEQQQQQPLLYQTSQQFQQGPQQMQNNMSIWPGTYAQQPEQPQQQSIFANSCSQQSNSIFANEPQSNLAQQQNNIFAQSGTNLLASNTNFQAFTNQTEDAQKYFQQYQTNPEDEDREDQEYQPPEQHQNANSSSDEEGEEDEDEDDSQGEEDNEHHAEQQTQQTNSQPKASKKKMKVQMVPIDENEINDLMNGDQDFNLQEYLKMRDQL